MKKRETPLIMGSVETVYDIFIIGKVPVAGNLQLFKTVLLIRTSQTLYYFNLWVTCLLPHLIEDLPV
jgi:hypothetical protein